ncbi:MAG TPA: phosphatase PAP2 family protein [Flavobacteriales bacterium]
MRNRLRSEFRKATWGLLGLLCVQCAKAQRDTSTVYRVNGWVDGPLIAAGTAAFITGMKAQNARPALNGEEVLGLGSFSVPGLDRAALRIDPSGQERAMHISDRVMYGTLAAPALLLLDGRVRKEWLGVYTLYFETAAITSGMQAWSCVSAGRYRPITYIESATLEQRVDQRNTNSFYSGHTANTAMASFFMAQVLSDMHPELGAKRWLLYGAAAVPPAVVGYYRIQAGKHFPTDVLTGALMGAATGVMVPWLHKRAPWKGHVELVPLASPELLGMHLGVRW